MSIRLMNHVWDNSPLAGAALLMLLAIADHANDDGVCWPSMCRLAQRVRLSVRQAQRLVRQLEAAGHIEVTRGQGRGNRSVITVKGETGVTSPQRKPDARTVELGGTGQDRATSSRAKGDIGVPSPQRKPDARTVELGGTGQDHANSSRVKGDIGVTSPQRKPDTHFTEVGETPQGRASSSRVKGDIPVTSSQGKADADIAHARGSESHDAGISRVKGDIRGHSPQAQADATSGRRPTKGDIPVPFSHAKADTGVLHFESERGTPSAQKVTSSAQKGDIRSHACVEPSIEPPIPTTATTTTSSPSGEALPVQHQKVRAPSPAAHAPPRAPTPQQLFFEAVCWVIGWDHRTLTKEQQGQVAQTLGVLARAEYQVEDLRRFWLEVWQKDWRYTKTGARPTLTQLRAEIGKLRVDERSLEGAKNGTERPVFSAEDEEFRQRLREARRRPRPPAPNEPPAAADQGVRLPKLP